MTLIVIIVDGKYRCSFDGDLQLWKHQRFFPVIKPYIQTSVTKLSGPANALRVKRLRIFANVHSESDMTLALFCYDMVDPTRKRIEQDMLRYEVEEYRKKSKG